MKFNMRKVNNMIDERHSVFVKEYLLAEVLAVTIFEVEKVRTILNLTGSKGDEHNITFTFRPSTNVFNIPGYKYVLDEFLNDEESFKLFVDKYGFEKFKISIVRESSDALELNVLFVHKKRSRLDVTFGEIEEVK